MYDYPLEPDWSTEEIIEVVGLYNAVEQAYEEGISSKEFMEHYRAFTSIADSKALQKQLDKAFEEASGYSIYKVFKHCFNRFLVAKLDPSLADIPTEASPIITIPNNARKIVQA